jgi:hypothetical protein
MFFFFSVFEMLSERGHSIVTVAIRVQARLPRNCGFLRNRCQVFFFSPYHPDFAADIQSFMTYTNVFSKRFAGLYYFHVHCKIKHSEQISSNVALVTFENPLVV